VEEGLARGGGGLVVRHADGVQLSDASEGSETGQRLEQTVEFDVTQGRWRGRQSFKASLG
jgi:hypothetical protein